MKHAMQPSSTLHDHSGIRLGSFPTPGFLTLSLSQHRESDQLETNWQQINKREICFQPDQWAGGAELQVMKQYWYEGSWCLSISSRLPRTRPHLSGSVTERFHACPLCFWLYLPGRYLLVDNMAVLTACDTQQYFPTVSSTESCLCAAGAITQLLFSFWHN